MKFAILYLQPSYGKQEILSLYSTSYLLLSSTDLDLFILAYLLPSINFVV